MTKSIKPFVNNQPQITGTSPRKDAVNSTPAPKPSTPAPIQPTKSTNTLAPPIVAPSSKSNSGFGTTLWNAVLGGWAGIDNNLAFGAFQNTFSAPTKEQQATKAYQFGKLAGDVVSIVVGGIELVVGGAGTATGIPMTGSVVLSGPGVLTTAASLAVAYHGMNGMINGARGIGDSAAQLFSSEGTGNTSKNIFGLDSSKTMTATELRDYAKSQGWTKTQTANGPEKWVDENGVSRITIKGGSDRAPGSADPHVEIKDASGQRIDSLGNPVTRKSEGNHTPIELK